MKFFNGLVRLSSSHVKRYFSVSARKFSYEGEGKTTVTILNKNYDYGLMVDGVFSKGFVLNNGIRTFGPMALFPKTLLSWNIASSTDMNERSLSLFLTLDPKLDILVIGLDNDYHPKEPFLVNVRNILKKHKILVEILPIYKACSTFNFLNAENRAVAAALIPPKAEYNNQYLQIRESHMRLVDDPYIKEDQDYLHPPKYREYRELNEGILEMEKEKLESLKPKNPWTREEENLFPKRDKKVNKNDDDSPKDKS